MVDRKSSLKGGDSVSSASSNVQPSAQPSAQSNSSNSGSVNVGSTHSQTNSTQSVHSVQVDTSTFVSMPKSELYKNYVIVALVTALLVFGVNWVSGWGDTPSGAAIADLGAGVDDQPSIPERVNLEVGDSPSIGSADAPVTIIEFSDYQCPFCGRFWEQTLPSLQREYIDTGKVRLAFKDFPLESIHQEALPAAHAARCAREQGGDEMYFKYHDIVFQNQQSLSSANYQRWASQLGLDSTKFSECMSSNKYLGAIRQDLRDGSAGGIQGTPGFFVNGVLVSGAQPFTVFQQIIESELSA